MNLPDLSFPVSFSWLLALLVPSNVWPVDFRVHPYLQYPTTDAVSVIWFSNEAAAGILTLRQNGSVVAHFESTPVPSPALAYTAWEEHTHFDGNAPRAPYHHRIRLTGLKAGTRYTYTVKQGESEFEAEFSSLPDKDSRIRIIALADCETEPESSGSPVTWSPSNAGQADREYLLDQTTGLANNLAVIARRHPDIVTISGDLVEAGGEQRDWDEFWRHFATPPPGRALASSVALLPAPGNHEYFNGRFTGQYAQPWSEHAMARYLSYFELPRAGTNARHAERYYRLDAGPVSVIALDVTNATPADSAVDTNYFLAGSDEEGGGLSPGFLAGTEQHDWLRSELADAQAKSRFTIVIAHHSPYSVGSHGVRAGRADNEDTQSGVPVRALTPLFMRYGVDIVLGGHGELWERSVVAGHENQANGGTRRHSIQFYDIGTCGDGLRGPRAGVTNPYQEFLAHRDAAEIWREAVLVDGGKHYGHLEIDITPDPAAGWRATLTPVYVFPVFDDEQNYRGFERRVYDDIVELHAD